MDGSPLIEANRRLLSAIETPPDTGLEDRIDRVAARLWRLERRGRPDPGSLCRLRQKLRALEGRTHERRARELARARRLLESYGRSLEPV